jgi:hypothetical protein
LAGKLGEVCPLLGGVAVGLLAGAVGAVSGEGLVVEACRVPAQLGGQFSTQPLVVVATGHLRDVLAPRRFHAPIPGPPHRFDGICRTSRAKDAAAETNDAASPDAVICECLQTPRHTTRLTVIYPLAIVADLATDLCSARARLRIASSTRIVVMCKMIEKGTR